MPRGQTGMISTRVQKERCHSRRREEPPATNVWLRFPVRPRCVRRKLLPKPKKGRRTGSVARPEIPERFPKVLSGSRALLQLGLWPTANLPIQAKPLHFVSQVEARDEIPFRIRPFFRHAARLGRVKCASRTGASRR